MYTGVIRTIGEIYATEQRNSGCQVRIKSNTDTITSGDSVSINGVCLTAETVDTDQFSTHLSPETIDRTYLSDLNSGDMVNIEHPVALDGRIDGHIMKGTVDTTTEVAAIEDNGDDWRFTFVMPTDYEQYLVEKGAVALDGISLTITEITDKTFSVAVIPATHQKTTLSEKSVGDPIHFEADILAKYVERQREVETGLENSVRHPF